MSETPATPPVAPHIGRASALMVGEVPGAVRVPQIVRGLATAHFVISLVWLGAGPCALDGRLLRALLARVRRR